MGKDYIEVNSFGKVFPKKGANARTPYEHQKNAMENLDIINKSNQYSTMIVLPNGGGKTYTASEIFGRTTSALEHNFAISNAKSGVKPVYNFPLSAMAGSTMM